MDEPYASDSINNDGFSVDDETVKYKGNRSEGTTLYTLLHHLISAILFPVPNASTPVLRRIKIFLSDNANQLWEASRNTGRNVLLWTRGGSPLRALFVITVGTTTLLTVTGLLMFMLFFLVATVNAIIISLLMSLAVAGGFLALFFACVTAIYIGALSAAAFVISTATISAVAAVIIATGWMAFFCIVWMATKRSVGIIKHSMSMTGSAISAYSSARLVRHHDESDKVSN